MTNRPTHCNWQRSVFRNRGDSASWEIMEGSRSKAVDNVADLTRILRKWNPLRGTLIARPGSNEFVPPLVVPEMQGFVRAELKSSQRRGIAMVLAFLVVAITVATTIRTKPTLILVGLLLFGLVMHVVDYFLLNSDEAIIDRTRFAHHLRFGSDGKMAWWAWVGFGLLIGLVQLILLAIEGSVDLVVIKYGTYFPSIEASHWWCLLTGPYIHANAIHYATNLWMLSFVGPVAAAVAGLRISGAVFLTGSSFGALAAFLINQQGHDSYTGMSAGVFALLGFVWVSGTTGKVSIPRGIPTMTGLLAGALAVGGEIVPSTSTIGHLSGFLVGAILGLCISRTWLGQDCHHAI